jgi:Peptidase A4 family
MRRVLLGLVTAVTTLAPVAALGSSTAAATVNGIFRPPIIITPTPGASVDNPAVTSTNWSGYAVTGTGFTDVVGTYVQPAAVSCSSTHTYSSFWVGIDGYSSDSVEQLGTDTDCSGGSPSYYAWYEMYPANSVDISTAKYPVAPGDKLTAGVKRSGTSYTLTLKDVGKWNFSITKTGADADSSAEWIAESPEICGATCSLAKLTDFGKVNWSASQAATGGALTPISGYTSPNGPFQITKEQGSTVEAVPSKLSATGKAFSITWKAQ